MCDENRVEYCFTWIITNFSLGLRHGKHFKSPIFTPDNFNGSKWYLSFKPLYRNKSCFLCRCKDDLAGEEIMISFAIDLKDGNGKIISTQGSNTPLQNFFRGTSRGYNTLATAESLASKCLTWEKDILTLRCLMFTTLKPHTSAALTEVGIDKCSFRWKLKLLDCVAASQTKTFSLSETTKYVISITALNYVLEIKVTRAVEDQSSARLLRGNIFFLNQEEVKVTSLSLNRLFDLTSVNTCKFTSCITKQRLEDNKKHLTKGCFTLLCEFATANGKESNEVLKYSSSECKNVQTLHQDLSNLFTSMKHSDVKLQCGDAVLSAHKSLLAARSPVFSAMFDHDMIEKQPGVVNIPGKDPETLKSFLDFTYTGRVDMKDYKSASKLLMIADEYQVASLKETCSMFLMSALTRENACEILELADMFNIKLLKNCALNYFAKHMQDISNSSQWSKFMEKVKNPKLWMEIIQHLAKNFEISPQGNKKDLKNAATKITAPGRNAKTVFSK